jgi:glutathione synthase/RimK-type ligase-like ATP-grasp enzyme
VWGDAADSPIDRVLAALCARSAEVLHIDAAALATARYNLVFDIGVAGWFTVGGTRIDVSAVQAIYLRPGPGSSARCEAASGAFLAMASTLPVTVINRPAAGRSNASKPYQLGIIAGAGLDVPDTLVTTDPDTARRFLSTHGRLVYKSISGIRSIVGFLEVADQARLADVASGPVQLQAYVPGLDVRVHVVGERWFACAIRSAAPDYRYAAAVTGGPVEMSGYDLPLALGRQLVALSRRMGLLVAGIDLRLTPAGRWVCFEEATGHPIAAAVASLLIGRETGAGRRAPRRR